MTRETKVGLIVGMGVILLIGIIVSDHLSVVNRQEPAGLTGLASLDRPSTTTGRGESSGRPSYTRPGGSGVLGSASSSGANSTATSAPPREPDVIRFGQLPNTTASSSSSPAQPPRTVYLPSEIAAGSAVVSSASGSPVGSGSDLLVRADSDRTALPTLSNTNVLSTPSAGGVSVSSTTGSSSNFTSSPTYSTGIPGTTFGESSLASVPLSSSGQVGASAAGPARTVAATNLQPVIHYVKAGQTLWQIAQQYYGSGDQWRAIADANPKAVDRNGSVREGVRLVIPNKAGLTQPNGTVSVASLAGSSNDAAVIARLPLARGGSESNGRTITVQKGDSLTRLAQQHLGSSTHWQQLFEANRDQLDRPDEIRVGMRLRLPAVSSNASSSVSPSGFNESGPSGGLSGLQASASAASGGRVGGSSPMRLPTLSVSGPAMGSASQTGSSRSGSAASASTTYQVKSSDSLYSIAAATLGDGNRWQEIYEANRDQLDSPHDIQPGQKLKIPSSNRH